MDRLSELVFGPLDSLLNTIYIIYWFLILLFIEDTPKMTKKMQGAIACVFVGRFLILHLPNLSKSIPDITSESLYKNGEEIRLMNFRIKR